MQRYSREDFGIGQGTNQIDKSVVNHSSSCFFIPSIIQGSVARPNSRDDFQVFSRREVESIKTRKRGATLVDTKSHP